MDNNIFNFIKLLVNSGWNCNPAKEGVSRKKNINVRLNESPSDFKEFVSSFDLLSNKLDTVWFTSIKDYSSTESENSFVWNEFEISSLEYAESDEEKKSIISFWDKTLPFLTSVKGGYSYMAIVLNNDDYGKIVYGQEPIYEDTVHVCDSFQEFLHMFSLHISGETQSPIFDDFM
ncbi:SMI1/KNR4 family protein [Muribaculum intestinale]|uniref:SMI1/KNR4 family protein n=1 Tax=Muribaculum intestinale TaxID=1796646 RepID=UPI00351923DC